MWKLSTFRYTVDKLDYFFGSCISRCSLRIKMILRALIHQYIQNYNAVIDPNSNGVKLDVHLLAEWTDCITDRILKKVEVGKFITTALKSILKLVKLQSLVAKCRKVRKI